MLINCIFSKKILNNIKQYYYFIINNIIKNGSFRFIYRTIFEKLKKDYIYMNQFNIKKYK